MFCSKSVFVYFNNFQYTNAILKYFAIYFRIMSPLSENPLFSFFLLGDALLVGLSPSKRINLFHQLC